VPDPNPQSSEQRTRTFGQVAFAILCFGLSIVGGVVLLSGLVVLGLEQTQRVDRPDRSTANRAVTYGPATRDAGGVYHGTHFRAAVPDGWEAIQPSGDSTGIELSMRRSPVADEDHVAIVVIVGAVDGHLSAEAYADLARQEILKDKSNHLRGGIRASRLAGKASATYSYADSHGRVIQTTYSINGGVAYTIVLIAPSGEFDAARDVSLQSFLSSWRWE
jgi:hypothetical protein